MSPPGAAGLVERCAATANRRERSDLRNAISEAIYEGELALRDLGPLFELESFDNWQSLTMILEEHSNRSDQVVDWLTELVESSSEEIRFRALLCVMELDPVAHPRLVARMLGALEDADLDAGRIAVTQYLAHVDLGRLAVTLPYLGAAQARALARFIEAGGDFYRVDAELSAQGSVEEFLGVASAARNPSPEAEEMLAELIHRGSDSARAAATSLLRQRQAIGGSDSSGG